MRSSREFATWCSHSDFGSDRVYHGLVREILHTYKIPSRPDTLRDILLIGPTRTTQYLYKVSSYHCVDHKVPWTSERSVAGLYPGWWNDPSSG